MNSVFKSNVRATVNGEWKIVDQVDSTYLIDSNGNVMKDPSTGKAYIIPVGYNPDDTIDRFFNQLGDGSLGAVEIYSELSKYKTGGKYDLQRSFNGHDFGGFVEDYTPIASFDVGLAAASGSVTLDTVELFGGLVNEKNVLTTNGQNFLTAIEDIVNSTYRKPITIPNDSGVFWNNKNNPPNIETGFNYYRQRTGANEIDLLDTLIKEFIQDAQQLFKQELDKVIKDASTIYQELSDKLLDLDSLLLNGENNLDSILSHLYKIFNNKNIENAKAEVTHAKSTSSPIILDLDSHGIATTAVQAGAYFDHAADGFAERTGWVGAGDGFLVRDLDGNGLIDTGAELFGSETRLADGTQAANGFEALKALDGNNDGQIDAGDAAFASLKIWIDANGDGYSQSGELVSLLEAGVASIATAYVVSDLIDANGNAHRQIGAYTRADGTQAAAEDVWFAVDRTDSLAATWADVPTEIAALPDLPGYGTVRDLRQAVTLDTTGNLKMLVAAYVTEPNEGQRHSLLNDIVYAWTDVAGLAPSSRGSYVDARQLAALEKLLGDGFYQSGWGANPGVTAGKQISAAFTDLAASLVAQLDAQTRYADLYAHVLWTWDSAAQTTQSDFTNAILVLQAELSADSTTGLALLDGFARNLKVLDRIDTAGWQSLIDGLAPAHPETTEILRRAQLDTLTGSAAADKLDGGSGDEYLLGFDGDDILNGQGGNDVLEGGTGQDVLEGGAGNDLVDGGVGDDLLDGNAGSDVYLFRPGFGQDHIHQYDSATDAVDSARFVGLHSQDVVRVTRQGDELFLDFATGDRLTVDGYFDAAPRRVDIFEFADGVHWDVQAIKDRADTLGTATIDLLYGYTGAANRIYGLDGNDELHGNSGNDVLSGGLGDDLLYGQAGDDVLDGGAGNDTLKGSTGNDSYVVDSTRDSVVEASGSGTDTVLSSVSYTLPTNVENLTLAADAGDIDAAGNTLANALTGNGGNNILNGGAGSDTLAGGDGADTFKLNTTTGGADLITDFLSGTDTIRINDLASGLDLGDKDGLIDNATTVPGPGGFSASNELVIVTGDISGLITVASAAATIGSAVSAYALDRAYPVVTQTHCR